MNIIEMIMLLLTAAYSIYAMVSDMRHGRISNRSVLISGIAAVILDAFYYSMVRPDLLASFGITVGIMTAIGAVMYIFNIWAAGDCKLLFVLSLSYPAGLYFCLNDYDITLWLSVAAAFLVGFMYIIAESAVTAIREKRTVSRNIFFARMKRFLLTYVTVLIYTAFINIILAMFMKADLLRVITPVFAFAVAIAVSKLKPLQNKIAVAILLVVDIALAIHFTYIPLSGSWLSYVVIIITAAAREFMGEYNYRTISAENVEPGMILSCASSALIQSSNIKGLPPISTEDLRSRLTQQQADSIKQWSKGSPLYEKISIVKKIPFAGFIAVGMIVYILLGVFVHAYLFQ